MGDFEYFLTEATEPIHIRRGDPLGFRAATDAFAERLAPGLSNRTYDARWLTLLSWALVHVREARQERGLSDEDDGLDQRREIYRWIRPLELMWVARAVKSFSDRNSLKRRQLPGRNAVARHIDDGGSFARWGLSADQYERYRFTGPHGAYRGLMAELDGFTIAGDGHRPGKRAERLARVVQERFSIRHIGRKRGKHPKPETYWATAWRDWDAELQERRAWLPAPWTTAERIRAGEIAQLVTPLFDRGARAQRRRCVAEVAESSRATTHQALLEDVVTHLRPTLAKEERSMLAPLPAFAGLADAGVEAMEQAWRALRPPHPPSRRLVDLAKVHECADALDLLRERAEAWCTAPGATDGPLLAPVAHLVERVARPKTSRLTMLEGLIDHHVRHGGGRRWFAAMGQQLGANAPTAGQGAAQYRFRLWSLARLAVQLGVIEKLPNALTEEVGDEEGEET